MKASEAVKLTSHVFQNIFKQDNPYTLTELRDKFAFDIELPTEVKDNITGQTTYTAVPNAKKFITNATADQWNNGQGWMQTKRSITGLKELLEMWDAINYITTERVYDSENVSASDPIYHSANVYVSTNCGECKNIIFCDGTYDSENAIACRRSSNLQNCLRVDDSNSCSNSYNVICSGKISNSFFIQDANSLHECMFCSHISNHEYCIANTQFEKPEYEFLKSKIIKWIFES